MHKFKKLALAAAIASTPMMATSLELLDDDMLSGVTGQDGIIVNLDANLTVDVAIEDTSGATTAAGASANGGFITLAGLGVNSNNITIEIDAGSQVVGSAVPGGGVLVVGVSVDEVTISNINVGVAGSSLEVDEGQWANQEYNREADDGLVRAQDAVDNFTTIVEVGDITLNDLNLAIELGPEASQFLTLSTGGTLDIAIEEFELTDPQGGGTLSVDNILVKGVDLDATVGITADGLVATTGGSNMDIALMGVSPGKGMIGNLYLLNLDMAGTEVTISGR